MSGTRRVQIPGVTEPITVSANVRLDGQTRRALQECATDFRAFLNVWHFRDGERRRDALLGASLWDGQERVVQTMCSEPLLIAPKARKTGMTTLACAFAGWVLRFQPDSVVSAISYKLPASMKLRDAVLYGLQRVPGYMRLPITHTKQTITVDGGGHLEAWPASDRAQVDVSATHTLVDELGRWIAPAATWQALQPSIAASCHVVSTSPGPESFMADLYRRSAAGDTGYAPVFVGALEREGRNAEWLEAQRRSLGPGLARVEYPVTVDDVLAGSGERFFPAQDVDAATRDAIPSIEHAAYLKERVKRGEQKPRYTAGVDVGVSDAFVISVLEHATLVYDVCHYVRATGLTYPEMAAEITNMRAAFPGVHIAIETNNAGSALQQQLPFPTEGLWTSARSKLEMLYDLQARLASQELKIPAEYEQLLQELRTYAIPDEHLVQDSVMALAVCLRATLSRQRGRVLGVIHA
jgi:hypothetical protein